MMPRNIGWHPRTCFHRPLHHCAIGVGIRFKAHHGGIQINRQRLRIVIDVFDSGWWISTRRTPRLFRYFNRRINDIHFRAVGDHAVERFDIVIAQANAAGADAHPDPEIRIRSVQKINPTICRRELHDAPSDYPGQQVPRRAGRYLELYNGRECLPSGSGRISALIRDGGDHGRCERIAPS